MSRYNKEGWESVSGAHLVLGVGGAGGQVGFTRWKPGMKKPVLTLIPHGSKICIKETRSEL